MSDCFQLRWADFGSWGGDVLAYGHVYGNPKFFEGYYIHTSVIREMTLDGSTLTLYTQNSIYQCSLEELCTPEEERETVVHILKQFLPNLRVEQLVWVAPPDLPSNTVLVQRERVDFETLAQQLAKLEGLPQDCFILCLDRRCSCDYFFSGFFKKTCEGDVQLLLEAPRIHLGMFQDSVLCLGELGNQQDYFDLRYFPNHAGIRLYRPLWDMGGDGLSETHGPSPSYLICNVGTLPLQVNDTELTYMEYCTARDDSLI